MKKKLLALFTALLLVCSLGMVGISASALDNSKTAMSVVNVNYTTSTQGIAICMDVPSTTFSDYSSWPTMDAEAQTHVSYVDSNGDPIAITSVQLNQNYIYINNWAASSTLAVGNKVTLTAGLVIGDYEIKEDITYVYSTENQPWTVYVPEDQITYTLSISDINYSSAWSNATYQAILVNFSDPVPGEIKSYLTVVSASGTPKALLQAQPMQADSTYSVVFLEAGLQWEQGDRITFSSDLTFGTERLPEAITYEYSTLNQPWTVYTGPVAPTLDSITAVYNGGDIIVGNVINGSQIVITANYSDSSTQPVGALDVEYWYGGSQITNPAAYVFDAAGTYDITVKYQDKETTMTVNVVEPAPTLDSITAVYNGGDIIVGNVINGMEIVITAFYSNDSSEEISALDVEYWYGGEQITNPTEYVFDVVGTYDITVKYQDKEATMTVNVVEPVAPTLESITAVYNGGDIIVGNVINGSQIVITAFYSDDSDEEISALDVEYWYGGVQITNPTTYVFDVAGTYDITVKYQGEETTMTVNVVEPAPTLDSITAVYNGGDIIVGNVINGMEIVITAFYSDDSDEEISALDVEYWYGGVQITNPTTYVFDVAGTYDITVKYQDKEATMTVNVVEPAPTLDSITAVYNGGNILVGEVIDGTEVVITAFYSDDSDEEISALDVEYWYGGVQITNPTTYVFDAAGTYEITVKYQGKQTTMTVNVVEPAPTLDSITAVYNGGNILVGEVIDGTEVVITAFYSDDSDEEISALDVEYWYGGAQITNPTTYVFEVAGTYEITVKYQGKETTMTLNVVEPAPTTYTVSFNVDGGSAVASQTVEEGLSATQPANPTKEGYTFDGWYADQNFTTEFDFNTAITEDTVVYAKWTEAQQSGGNQGGNQGGNGGGAESEPQGCGGAIGGGSIALLGLALAGVVVARKTRKKED